MAIIEHPPGEETQWDWVELPDPPAPLGVGVEGVSVGRRAGALRAVARRAGRVEDQPHLIDAPRPDHPRPGWADPKRGGSTGWPPSATRHRPGHRLVRRGRQALRRVGGDLPAAARATARAWWRRPTTPPRNAGGAPCPTTSPSSRPRPRWTGSLPCAATPGCARPADGRATVATVAAARAAAARSRRRRSRPR